MSKKQKRMGIRDVAKAATAADTASYVLSLPKDYDFTKLPELDNRAWAMILAERPELAEHCDFSKFTASDWIAVLLRQPGMASRLRYSVSGNSNDDDIDLDDFDGCLDALNEGLISERDSGEMCSLWGLPRFVAKKSDTCTGGKWQYVLRNGKAIITGLVNRGEHEWDDVIEELRIPSRIDGHSVLTIAEDAFSCFYRLRKVVVASGVKEIGPGAFSGCNSLSSVILPASIKAIQPQAFRGCALRSIAIPEKCEYIGYHAFDGNPLESVEIPSSVKELGANAFQDCKTLRRFVIKNRHCRVGQGVLLRCPELRQVFTPFKKHYLKPSPYRKDSDVMFRTLMSEDMTCCV